MMVRRGHVRQASVISVRRLAPARAVKSREVVRAVRLTAGDRRIRSISVVLADDDTLARLHARYLDDASPTDVLTFDLRDDEGQEGIEGEVVISVEIARREAKRRRLSEAAEILRYVIHGTLHLLGYDDATPAQRRRMRTREDAVLKQLRGSGRRQ